MSGDAEESLSSTKDRWDLLGMAELKVPERGRRAALFRHCAAVRQLKMLVTIMVGSMQSF